MEQKKLRKQLSSYPKVFADTPIFLYFFEENKRWEETVETIFKLAEQKEFKLVTSTITTLEVITGLKKEKAEEEIKKFKDMLEDFEVEVLDFEEDHVELAARLRADYGFKTPDSIQLAITIEEQISAFVTNDKQLTSIENENTKVVYLGDYNQ